MLARYPTLRDTTVQITNTPSGYVTRAWRIDTTAGSFLLRRHPADTVAEDAATSTEVHALAARAGLAPALVANEAGGLITNTGGRLFTLTAHLGSATPARGVPGPALCHRLGHALGRLHQQLREAPAGGGLRHWHLPGTAALRAALHAHDRPGCHHPFTRRILQVKLAHAQAIPVRVRTRLNNLDQQVIHGDVHPANILLTSTQPVFIDFDLARSAPPAYELMRALIYCTHPAGAPEAYRDRVIAFLRGYLTVTPLTERQIATMVELFRAVQILDPYGLHACENAQETLLGFRACPLRAAVLDHLSRHRPHRTHSPNPPSHHRMTAMTTGKELRSIAAGLAEAATPHLSLLTGGPISLRVTSTSPGPLTALAAAATPYLQPTDPDDPHRTPEIAEQIRIHADPVMADRLRRLADSSADHGVRLVRACAGGGEQHRETFLLWDQSTRIPANSS